MIAIVGWRLSFAAFGVYGLVWCWLFWRWYRDDPANHPTVNEAELAYIRYGGTATGFMNTASSASSVISPITAAWLAARFGSFESMFWDATVVYLIGALLWFLIDPERRVRG